MLTCCYQFIKEKVKKFDFWNVGPDKRVKIRVIDIKKLRKINNEMKIKIIIKKKSFKESHFLLKIKIKKIGWKNKIILTLVYLKHQNGMSSIINRKIKN